MDAFVAQWRTRLSATVDEHALAGDDATALTFRPAGAPAFALALWHGGGNDRVWGFWALIEAVLEAGGAVTTAHLPGHGPGRDAFSLSAARSRLAALLTHADRLAPHTALLGQSMGGALVLDGLAGGLRPDRAIVVSAPLAIPLGPGLLRELGFWWGPEARRARRYVSAIEALPAFGPFRRARFPVRAAEPYVAAFRRALAELDLERRLAAGRAQLPPVLLVHGTHDGVIPYFHAERLAAALNDAGTLRPVPGGHHFNPLLRDDVLGPVLDWARAASPHPVAAP
ncbi:MAG: alpha/beta hydrolase, partial [Candidatus Sericytochromatia bacterium]